MSRLLDWFPCLYRRTEQCSRRQQTSLRRRRGIACLTICLLNVSPVNAKLTSPSYAHQYIFLFSASYSMIFLRTQLSCGRSMVRKWGRDVQEIFTRSTISCSKKSSSWTSSNSKLDSKLDSMKFETPAPETVATSWIAHKICQSHPPTFGSHCSSFHPNRFTFGGVIAERVNTVLLTRRVFPIFAFGRIINGNVVIHTRKQLVNIFNIQ